MIFSSTFFQEIIDFIGFLIGYIKSRLINFGVNFEKSKDIIVALLIVKRGKYSQSFLNTAFFLLVSLSIIIGPTLAESNPFFSDYQTSSESGGNQSVLAFNSYNAPFETTISQKPRDTIVEYKVEGGDTLASISKKFDVSVDTLKWANNLKSDTIKPNQIVKVPPISGVVHKVVSGDTVYSVAKKYRTDAQKIVNFPFNDFADLDTFALSTGQVLYVPDGVVVEEARPYVPAYAYQQISAGQSGSGSFIWPTSGIITQYPIWYHMALDIAANNAPAILSSDAGTVVYSGCINWGYGCHVIVDHGNGYQTLYGHLSSLGVSVGQGVSRGGYLGKMGSTGKSTGPHLHFEIRNGGKLLNPLSFLK